MATIQPLTFAQVLRRARLAAGLTQEALAERAGLAVRSISDLERGQRRAPYKATLGLLADALRLTEHERAAFAAAASGHAPPASHESANSAPPFVGRATELERLDQHLAGQNRPVLLLAGEPGIGKSRLLRESTARAQAAGWSVIEGGCTRRSGQELYAPLVGALARYQLGLPVAALRAHLQGCAWLVRLLPELAERAVVPLPEWALAPEQERRLMFAAVARFLTNSAGPAGTLLVLDDLQWAGVDALDLLESLARAEAAHPLRVLGAYRSTETHPGDHLGHMLADLARDGLVAELAIGPLDGAAAAELAAHLLPSDLEESHESATRATARRGLIARAGGVPFFLVSGARALASGAATEVPWDVGLSIRLRVSALPEAAREMLGAAAVAGRVVPGALLLALTGRPEREMLAALKAACQGRLLVEMGRAEYAFVHDLVREAVDAELSLGERAAWHRRIGEWMERLPERERTHHHAEIAQHFAESDQRGRALPYALATGDQAEAAYAHTEAEAYYRMALELAREQGDQAREATAWEGLQVALNNQARFDAAQEAADQAATVYQALGDTEGALRALHRYGEMSVAKGRPLPGLARLEPLRAQVEASAPTPAMARYLATLSHLYHQASRPADALATAERAVEIARTLDYAAGLAHGQHVLVNALGRLGRTAEMEQALEQVVPLCEAAGDLLHLALGLRNVAHQHAIRGDLVGAREPLERAIQVAEQLGEAQLIAEMSYEHGMLAFWLGEWDRAATDFERAMRLYRQVGPAISAAVAPFFTAMLLIAQGQREPAHTYFEEALANVNDRYKVRLARDGYSLEAEDALLRGQAEVARDLLEPLYDSAAPESAMPMLAWAYADLSQPERAAAVLESYMGRAIAAGNELDLVEGHRVQALLDMHQNRWREAADRLEDVIARCQRIRYPYAEAKALYIYGLLERARNQPQQARARFMAALAILNRLGERMYAEQIECGLAGLP